MKKIPSLLEMIRQLVAIPSVSSTDAALDVGNRKVSELLATWCESLGFRTVLHPVPGKPDHMNLVATAGHGAEGLVLAGHSDTVPFDEHLWSSNPFILTERAGCLHGLGTADMKAFFAFALSAASRLDLSKLSAPLTIVATADEETGMMGARALAQLHLPGRHVVIGEPTGGIPVRMHKGNMMHRLRLIGQSGHSSDPSLGKSALEGMHAVMTDLMLLRTTLQSQYQNPGFAVPTPTLNFGCIHGGDNPNRICGSCEMSFDFRLLPGMDGSQIREIILRRAKQIAQERALQVELEILMDIVPGMETSAHAPIVQASERISGHTAQAVSFTTEGPFYHDEGMDVIIMGPGNIACAHQPDEHIIVDRLDQTTGHLEALVHTFCSTSMTGHRN
ncbi:acetylornithine deacetylase [Alcaligenaceae bacterium CGII-47]|nr:acetylornithine deacetylase [Alcaligenaceae bacterium CGII-47]